MAPIFYKIKQKLQEKKYKTNFENFLKQPSEIYNKIAKYFLHY